MRHAAVVRQWLGPKIKDNTISVPASVGASASASGTTGTGRRQRKEEMSEFDKGRIIRWNDEGVSKTETGAEWVDNLNFC